VNKEKKLRDNTISLLSLAMLIQSKDTKLKKEYTNLKKLISELNDLQILYNNITDNNTFISGDSMYSTHMYLSDNDTQLESEAVKNGFPIFDLKACEKLLRKYYNISDSEKLIYLTNNINIGENICSDPSTTFAISVYSSVTKQKLNLNICKDLKQTIQVPINNLTNLNMTLYRELKKQGIDIFDPNNTYFNDRCASYVDINKMKDTTINSRNQNFLQSTLPRCKGLNCTYNGISDNGYVNCTCGVGADEYFINEQVIYAVKTFSRFNLDVITCASSINVKFN
jgi:hypothetical protein